MILMVGARPVKKTKLIRIGVDTNNRLLDLGDFGESYDSLLNRILDIFELKAINALLEGTKSRSQIKEKPK